MANLIGKKIKHKNIYWKGKYGSYFFTYNETWNSLTIMLEHKAIKNYTSEQILENTKNVVMQYFKLEQDEINKIVLTRIDIKTDYRYKNEEELKIIKNIIEKAKSKLLTYIKITIQNDENGYTVKYIAKGTEEKNDKDKKGSRYIEVTIYDKEKETENRVKERKATEEEIGHYKNIIRIELKIKNGKLNSNKYEDKKESKNLQTYYNDYMTTDYFEKYISKIFGKNRFYRIDVAIDKINNIETLKAKKKQKLCRLLKLINKVGYTEAERLWTNKYCKATFYAEVTLIEKQGINILTFDKKIKGKDTKVKCIRNFALMKNGIQEI